MVERRVRRRTHPTYGASVRQPFAAKRGGLGPAWSRGAGGAVPREPRTRLLLREDPGCATPGRLGSRPAPVFQTCVVVAGSNATRLSGCGQTPTQTLTGA